MDDDLDVRGPRVLGGVGRGVAIAALNVGVVATLLAIATSTGEVFALVVMCGGVPGVALGLVLGIVAAVLAHSNPWVRRVVILLPALALVWGLAHAFEMRPFAELAAVPTLFAALGLEHLTRRTVRPLAPARVAAAPTPVHPA